MLVRRFPAMGSAFELILDAPPHPGAYDALDRAERVVGDLEARLSRFRSHSELSALNALGSAQVGRDLLRVTELALHAREETGGRFDPTVLHAVAVAGYDRSFDDMPADTGGHEHASVPAGGRVDIDVATGRVTLGEGVGLDLGGIAKGYAAEAACDLLSVEGPCLVNAGGDIATRNVPEAGTWAIGVDTATGPLTLGIDGGGVATSGRDRRRWRAGGRPVHHVIDPATGRPAETDVLRITIVAESAVRAEALATALFLAGSERAIDEASALGVAAIVTTDERTLMTEGL